MKITDVKEITKKYFQAETTLEEERALRESLLNDEGLNEHPELKALFGYYQLQKESVNAPEFLNPAVESPVKKTRIISMPWLAAAASIIILVSTWFFFNPFANNVSQDTFTDPEIAAQNAAEAIQLLSVELNKGRTLAVDQMKEFDSLNKYLNIF